MKWRRFWPETLVVALVIAFEGIRSWRLDTRASSPLNGTGWTPQRKLASREKTRELWYHGFESYMRYAFPLDELTPLSCSGQGPDWARPQNIASNDVAGNFSLTLIDVLDTFVVLDDRQGFEKAVRDIINWVSFDVNTKPQVFETTIRVLGGLLSGHIFANQTGQPFYLPWYRGELLDLAYDLGQRLLPAFSTPTGLPYARINLRHGLLKGETLETCTAGAGSLILEFGTLSRFTGDKRFEKAAYRAFFGLWNRKSDIGLVGNTINTWTGTWTSPETTGIGAGIDSFYEYALKWYILSGEVEFLDVWDDAYAAIMRYSRSAEGYWYRTVNMNSGDTAYNTVDSLSAFWPGLQVLAGDVQSAIKLHMLYYNLWRAHSGLPEVYDTNYKKATSFQYPLRPELVESTWYLYRATRDPFYLDVGERILFDITTRAKVDCGLAGIQDLRTNKRDDRMESFALSETLKYLYLLFDEDNALHSDDSNYVLTTEGHILTLGREHINPPSAARRKIRTIESHQCPAYQPFVQANDGTGMGLVQGIRSRGEVEYARELVGLQASQTDMNAWSSNGWCEKPKVELYAYDFVLSANGKTAKEDLSPSLVKLAVVPDGFVIHNVTGIRTHIVKRMDGKGYDIRKLGHYTVRPGQLVYINDTALFQDEVPKTRDADLQLQIFVNIPDSAITAEPPLMNSIDPDLLESIVTGYSATFAGDLSLGRPPTIPPLQFLDPEGLPLSRDLSNPLGCQPFTQSYPGSILVADRGECTFLEKLVHARQASAAGVIIISDDDAGVNPSTSSSELAAAGEINDVALVLLPQTSGALVLEMMNLAGQLGLGQVKAAVEPPRIPFTTDTGHDREDEEEKSTNPNRILYLNGYPLLNTRLLV
ncbi:alpha mannosidase-like protein [Pluteus cervinus]|uniref:Alpha mannosidase-like protein n=1 Tax=Pluteus cervinus TaxID=181527 RepID=A0ACD3BD31_9AGAR|nr:alpha mannosidase-like protein [Pluteus cervinus]